MTVENANITMKAKRILSLLLIFVGCKSSNSSDQLIRFQHEHFVLEEVIDQLS